jgi:hypothetical protein
MSMAFLDVKIQRINILIGVDTWLIRPPTSGYIRVALYSIVEEGKVFVVDSCELLLKLHEI